MKHLLKILIPSLILIGCEDPKEKGGFSITGSIEGEVPEKIYLKYEGQTDSALVENKRFHFSGSVENSSEAEIYVSGISAFAEDWIYLENSDIELNLHLEKKSSGPVEYSLISVDRLTGTKTREIRNHFESFADSVKNNPNRQQLLFKKIEQIVEEHPKNRYSSYLVISHSKDLQLDQLRSLAGKLDTTAMDLKRKDALKRATNPNYELKKGSEIVDFSLKNTEGKLVSTKDLRNKTILIDFWASWCGPCRKKHPKLKEIYNKYKNEDFEILAVSLDKDQDKWRQAIEKDGLTWINVNEDKGFDGRVASRYDIHGIPATFLINGEGMIVAKNISREDLEEYISES